MDLRTVALDAMALLTTAPMNNNSSRYLYRQVTYGCTYYGSTYYNNPSRHSMLPVTHGSTYYGRYGKFLTLTMARHVLAILTMAGTASS